MGEVGSIAKEWFRRGSGCVVEWLSGSGSVGW